MSKNSITKGNKKKNDQLGMAHGTANGKLRKMILFSLVKETNKNICYRCEKEIESIDVFTIEHKDPWLDSNDPVKLFFDLNNIAFSHTICNYQNARKTTKGETTVEHGTTTMYRYGCRCLNCRKESTKYRVERRRKALQLP